MGSRATVVIKTYGEIHGFNNVSIDVINFLTEREKIDNTQYLNWVVQNSDVVLTIEWN